MVTNALSNTLDYELGVLRSFGDSDVGEEGLSGDWASPEASHIWNDGENPTLILITDEPGSPCLIEVEGTPFISPGCPRQAISLYANGFWINSWDLTDGDVAVLSGVIEPEQFFKRGTVHSLKLVWHIPTSISPSALGEGGDGRALGFCFRSVRLSPIE